MFEPEKMMKSLSGDMIIPKFGEYNYYHEAGTKPELIFFGYVILFLFLRKRHNRQLILVI